MPVPPQPQHLLRSHGYLVAQHERPEVLQAIKVITGHLTLRPTGMPSEAHSRLVRAVGQKHNKVARFRMAPNELVTSDPNIPARLRCTPRARPPLHHTHTPARPHLQATRPPIPHAMFWVSEKRSGGCLCITDTQQSFTQRPHARPSSFAGHAPALSSRHARPPSFAGHAPARPSRHARPSSFAGHTRPVPHVTSCLPRLQATRPPIPHVTPTHPAILISRPCRLHAGPSLMTRSHGRLSSFAGHAPAHPSRPPTHPSRHAHIPGRLRLHASHAPAHPSPHTRPPSFAGHAPARASRPSSQHV